MFSVISLEEISPNQTWLDRVTDWTQSVSDLQQDSFLHQMGTFGVSRLQQESMPGTFGPHAGLVIPEAAVSQPVSRSNPRLAAQLPPRLQPGPLFGPQADAWLTSEAAAPQSVSRISTRLDARPRPGTFGPQPGIFGPQAGLFSTEAAVTQPVSRTSTRLGAEPGPRPRPTNNYNHMDEDDEGPWDDALLDASDYLPPSEPSTVVSQLYTTKNAVVWQQMMSDDDRGPVLWGTPGFKEARTIRDPYALRDANGSLVVPPAPYPGSRGAYPGSNLPTGYPPPLPWQ
ncbi:hypothetical protein CSOJ01_03874 [Colletotrichum sojae]|uniref:Uncharacterized protein n=1 Tax=Colletotrichum sojae TaxID=2175907 RepID=A0A8H6N0B6_9PEZI|nr:hypothetical protein CSOJ01_03874 [Colletotrichum sojae]